MVDYRENFETEKRVICDFYESAEYVPRTGVEDLTRIAWRAIAQDE